MDFSLLLWLLLFVVVAVMAVKIAIKISKVVVSIVSVIIVLLVLFGFLTYNDIINIGDFGLKERSKSILSEGKDKITGYVVEYGKELLGFDEEKKEGDS